VDFALSYLRIRHRLHAPVGSNMRDQIGALAAAGALPEADSRGLLAGAGFLRAFEHAVRLVTGRASRGWHDRPGQAEGVAHLLRHWRLLGLHSLPLKHLESVQEQIREIYRRILGPE
jgi:hypothetical protein